MFKMWKALHLTETLQYGDHYNCLLFSAEASSVSEILWGKMDKKIGSFYSL